MCFWRFWNGQLWPMVCFNFIANSLPSTPMPRNQSGHDVTVHTVKLSRSSAEYRDLEMKFYHSAGNLRVLSIERIQDPHLYQAYQLRKAKMDKDNGGNNERQLFHGTSPHSVSKINTQGFRRSFSGAANGILHWYGIYYLEAGNKWIIFHVFHFVRKKVHKFKTEKRSFSTK